MAQNLSAGHVVGIMGSENNAADSARESAIYSALNDNDDISVVGTSYGAWKKTDAKAAMAAFLTDGQTVDGVITEEGMAEGVLEAFVEAGALPKVMCGDVTAGFIKKWYALKNGGLSFTPAANKKQDKNNPEPTPEPVLLLAQPGEMMVCAQPAPTALGAAAFEIALKLAEGRKLKKEGLTYAYQVETLITDDNLTTYYEQIKDKDDAYIIRDFIVTADIEALFEPAEEKVE
jgi:ribose transport system substrate-binding protein